MCAVTPTSRPKIVAFVAALRPRQWAKNVFVLAPLVFAGKLFEPHATLSAVAAMLAFCALSSSVYLLNDVRDREADRLHPTKKNRPIAAGEIAPSTALAAAAVLGAVSLAASFALSRSFGAVALAYAVSNLAYSLGLKRVVILDVMIVASGFLLRAWGGALVLPVAISHWLILCTGLLALFLGFVKRRQEISSLDGGAATRPILREYSLPFLDQMISIVTGATVVAYALYAFSPEVAEKLGTQHLGLTIPFVLFGIFRYLYLVHQKGEGENPTALFLGDGPLLLDIALWGAAVVVALYLWR